MIKVKGGYLIAIEGIDGVGKTTQSGELKKRLETLGYRVVLLKEPTNSEYGRQIRNISLHNNEHFRNPERECKLFIEDRKIDVKKNILPNLENGNIVIMDRYYYSNMAYQGVLGLVPEDIKQKNERIAPIPQIVFIMDILPSIGVDRIINKRKEKTNSYERIDYLEKVREYFLNMRKYPNVRIIEGDGSRSIQEVTDEMFSEIKKGLINNK